MGYWHVLVRYPTAEVREVRVRALLSKSKYALRQLHKKDREDDYKDACRLYRLNTTHIAMRLLFEQVNR